MNADSLVTQLRSKKAYLWIDKTELVIQIAPELMTPKIVTDIRKHKSEIINFLKSANKERQKKYAYHYELNNNAGAGTWLTYLPPEKARKSLEDFYIGREIKEFDLIN